MTLGILNTRARRAMGAYASQIPSECWDQTGFKDCHTKAYAKAQAECQKAGLPNDEGCIGASADSITMSTCKCVKKGTTTKKPVVVSSAVKPTPEEAFGPEPGLFGMDPKTLVLVGLVGAGLYMFMGQKKGKS